MALGLWMFAAVEIASIFHGSNTDAKGVQSCLKSKSSNSSMDIY